MVPPQTICVQLLCLSAVIKSLQVHLACSIVLRLLGTPNATGPAAAPQGIFHPCTHAQLDGGKLLGTLTITQINTGRSWCFTLLGSLETSIL